MAFVYKIVNDINEKLYIGITLRTLDARFAEHCYEARSGSTRPLYCAMRKYGIEHFHVVLLEETDFPQEREKYWIAIYDTYRNGYNAALGGDGTFKIDYDAVVDAYATSGDPLEAASELGISYFRVRL